MTEQTESFDAMLAALREYRGDNRPDGDGPSFAAGWEAGCAYERRREALAMLGDAERGEVVDGLAEMVEGEG